MAASGATKLAPTKLAKLIALKLVQGEYANIAAAESALGYPAGYVEKQNVGYWKKKLGELDLPTAPSPPPATQAIVTSAAHPSFTPGATKRQNWEAAYKWAGQAALKRNGPSRQKIVKEVPKLFPGVTMSTGTVTAAKRRSKDGKVLTPEKAGRPQKYPLAAERKLVELIELLRSMDLP